MRASIITIGDEILIGQITDTNSTYIAKSLSNIGLRIGEKLSIGDSADQIRREIERAIATYDVVITTGGLGPTKDDITKECIAEIFDSKMINHPHIAQHIESLLSQRGVVFNSMNAEQAMLPEACTPLFNAHGTAPGMWFEREGHILISLPGVPFEMCDLIDNKVLPALKERFDLGENIHRTMITSGLAESMLAEHIEAWEDALPHYIKLAYLPSFGRVRLRLSAYQIGSSELGAVSNQIERAFGELEGLIPQYFVGYEGASIEELVHNELTQRGAKLAIAESCTGGCVAAKFTALAGASAYFQCGLVTYSNESKEQVLGVKRSTIEQHGAVSEEVATEMALGAKRVGGADYAIATTGIAGPTGGSQEKPVGTIWFAIATPEGVVTHCEVCGTERSQVIGRGSATAIRLLKEAL